MRVSVRVFTDGIAQFEVQSITGAVVDLIGDGKRTPVTADNAAQYFDMAVAFRLGEFNRHVSAACHVVWRGSWGKSTGLRGGSTQTPCFVTTVVVCLDQVAAIRQGLVAVVPALALQLCSWKVRYTLCFRW